MTQADDPTRSDVATTIADMKRLARVDTDQELARFIGLSQSTVSNWRKRGAVPEKATLQFERALETKVDRDFSRSLSARTVALRLPELWLARKVASGGAARMLTYSYIAYGFNAIVREIARNMQAIEGATGRTSRDLVPELLEDDRFLNGILDWFESTSMAEMIHLEGEASRALVRSRP